MLLLTMLKENSFLSHSDKESTNGLLLFEVIMNILLLKQSATIAIIKDIKNMDMRANKGVLHERLEEGNGREN